MWGGGRDGVRMSTVGLVGQGGGVLWGGQQRVKSSNGCQHLHWVYFYRQKIQWEMQNRWKFVADGGGRKLLGERPIE